MWVDTRVTPMRDQDGGLIGFIGVSKDITDRRRAAEIQARYEAALHESAERLRLLVEKMPAVLWSTDADLRVTSSAGGGLAALGLETSDRLPVARAARDGVHSRGGRR